MDFLPYGMASHKKEALPAVNADIFTEVDNMAVYFTALFIFINTQILAADNTGLFELCRYNSCVGGLAAAGGQETLGLGDFLYILRNRILADQDQGAVRVFLCSWSIFSRVNTARPDRALPLTPMPLPRKYGSRVSGFSKTKRFSFFLMVIISLVCRI